MKWGLRTKIFLIAFSLIGVCLAVAYVYARNQAEQEARARLESELVVRLQLVIAQAENSRVRTSQEWDTLADRLARVARTRVSFISRDGQVWGDSLLEERELPHTESHLLRPEIQGALRGGIGVTERFSSTAHHDMLYVAGPLVQDGETLGVVRVAWTTEEVERAVGSLRQTLVAASFWGLCVALVIAFVTAQWATLPVRTLTHAATRMAAGDLSVRARIPSNDEFAKLGAALDSLVENLSLTLDDLRKERDRMSGILSSMEEGVLFLDEEGRVALVNPALRDMLLLQGDPTGRSLLEVVRHAELKEMLDAAAGGEDEEEEEGRLQGEIHVSGLKPRRLLVRAQKLDGVTSGVVAIFLDMTETRRLENLRREFVANVSHELRTPVTSIRSAAETLSSALVQDPTMAKRFVEIIDRNAARLHSLVEDLLDLSRIESRQFSLTLAELSPLTVMSHMMSLFAERAQKREIELVMDVPAQLPSIRADRRALEHILSNLVDNAVKYAGVGKKVVLSARVEGQRVTLQVSDNGPGIDPRHLSRLFERFYRVDAGRSRDLGGTGLGLSIVKNLVESMSGSVSVKSEVGQGTTFSVQLPAVLRAEASGALLN